MRFSFSVALVKSLALIKIFIYTKMLELHSELFPSFLALSLMF